MTRPLTERQRRVLDRIRKQPGGRELISPDLAKQLAKRGIVRITGHKWCRKEWNRPVKGATLWEVQLVK
jgi:hypothetical protein